MNDSKRVIFVLPDLSVIGAQRVAVDYGNQLLSRGFDVEWFAGGAGEFSGDVPSSRVKLFAPRRFKNLPGVRVLESWYRLAQCLTKEDKLSVVIGVSPLLNRVLSVLKLLGKTPQRLVLEDHAYPPRSYFDEFGLIARFFYRNTEFLYNQATALRVLSPECREYYSGRLRRDLLIVSQPNFFDFGRLRSLAARFKVEAKNLRRIVYIGRQVSQKNIAFLIDSFAELSKTLDAEFVIIGYGPLHGELREQVAELGLDNKVTFLESSPSNYAWLASADLFPIASLWEGMVLTIGEAMCLGVPVVSTRFVAGPEFYVGQEEERGWLVAEGDVSAFSEKMKVALVDTEQAKQKASKAKTFVIENLSIEEKISDYISTFIRPTSEA